MKIVQSFWSRPMSVMHPFTGGWPEAKYYWYAWILSANQAKATHDRVELVTDRDGAKLLVDDLGLPFDRVDTALDEADAHPGIWKFGKVLAYERQHDPFLHIESDVFLWKRLPDELLEAPLLVQQIELPWHDRFQEVIDSRYEQLARTMRSLPPSWKHAMLKPGSQDDKAAALGARVLDEVTRDAKTRAVLQDEEQPNRPLVALHCGVFGGHDLDTIHRVAREVRGVAEQAINRTAWLAMRGGHPIGRDTYPNALLEHYTAYAVAFRRGVDVWSIFPPGTTEADSPYLSQVRAEAFGFTHIMNEKASALNSGLADRLERRIQENYSEHYERVQSLITKQQVQPSKLRQAGNMLKSVSHAAGSIARTKIAGQRLSNEAYQQRLDVCQQCPGGHAKMRRGEVHSCGPMLASIKGKKPTCGCYLKSKARDPKQDCPMGYWPKSKPSIPRVDKEDEGLHDPQSFPMTGE
ncbi:MAG: DUF6734 family protein [Planctomycetota bacterium]